MQKVFAKNWNLNFKRTTNCSEICLKQQIHTPNQRFNQINQLNGKKNFDIFINREKTEQKQVTREGKRIVETEIIKMIMIFSFPSKFMLVIFLIVKRRKQRGKKFSEKWANFFFLKHFEQKIKKFQHKKWNSKLNKFFN